MIRCTVKKLEPGMVLGKSLFDAKGKLLLAAGHRLDKEYIFKISARQFHTVFIYQAGTEEVLPEDLISEELRAITSQKLQENIDELQKLVMKVLPKTGENLARALRESVYFDNVLNMKELSPQMKFIVEEVMSFGASKKLGGTLRSAGSYQYEHALEVMLVSIKLGMLYSYSYQELLHLGIAGLLHDIGKTVIPDIAEKPKEEMTLDQRILLREHPVFSSILIEKSSDGMYKEQAAVLQHHEQQNGKGYPLKKIGFNLPPVKSDKAEPNRIFRYAEIIAVADAYDNYASPRPGHAPMSPENAYKSVKKKATTILNTHIVNKLSEIVDFYPRGSLVKVERCGDSRWVGCTGAVKDYRKIPLKVEIVFFLDANGGEMEPVIYEFKGDLRLKLNIIM